MIEVTITGRRTGGKALLYEFPGKKGKRTFVPTYAAVARHLPTNQQFVFAVVRDSSVAVFGGTLPDPYGEGGECPPCADAPYRGAIREGGPVGFRVALFEPPYQDDMALIGQGKTMRTNIQIHFGAAASHGCILVAGRRRLYPQVFERPLRAMLVHTKRIQVVVEPRR